VLKLFPKPKGKEVAWAGVASPEMALSLFRPSEDRAGAALTAFELIGQTVFGFAQRHVAGAVRPLAGDWPWHVLMEISSGRSAEERARSLRISRLGHGGGLRRRRDDCASLGQAADFWKLRESLSDAQRPEGASIKHDFRCRSRRFPNSSGARRALSPPFRRTPGSPASATWATATCTTIFPSRWAKTQTPSSTLPNDEQGSACAGARAWRIVLCRACIGQLKRDELLATARLSHRPDAPHQGGFRPGRHS